MRFLPRHVRRPSYQAARLVTATAIALGGFAATVPNGTAVAAQTAAQAPGEAVPDGEGGIRAPDGEPAAEPTDGEPTGGARHTPLASPSESWPKGIDVASWQHPGGVPIDWNAVRDSGVRFAIVKATEGRTYTNPYFVTDRGNASAAGLVVGAYHYARPALPMSTAAEQARRFLDTVGDVRINGHLAPALDLEATGGLNPGQLAAWARTFLEEIETRTGRAPILYTYRSFWTDIVGNDTAFSRYPLWFAIYNEATTPGGLPGGWQNWTIWQHSSVGRVPGIDGNVDLNAFCCTLGALAANGDGRLGELAKRYASDRAVQWVLGPPTGADGPAGGGGRWRPHQNGLLFWSVTTGALEVHGSIAKKYLALLGSNGFLRRPLTDETNSSAPRGRQSVFQGGRIYWSEATGAFEVHGAILTRYLKLGGSGSYLGLPVSDEYSVPGGRRSDFQGGYLRWDAGTGQVTVIGT